MLRFNTPKFALRRAGAAETGLLEYLRFAWLLSLEMSDHALGSVKTLMASLPDIDAKMVAAGRYYVADGAGDLIAGAGWSVLPLSYRGDELRDERGASAALQLGSRSALVRGFFLDPDLGRRGIGPEMLAHIEADILANGFSSAEIVVPASAENVYRGLGFRSARRLGLELGGSNTLPLVQMRKSLTVRLAAAA
jgi:GNAT superfamily N-acetyltransferase